MKRCNLCGLEKELEEFQLNPQGKYGRKSKCRLCINRTQRRNGKRKSKEDKKKDFNNYYQESKEKILMKQKDYSKTEAGQRRSFLRRLRKYGLNEEQYNQKFIEQKGCCDICGKHQSELKRTLSIDHNHKTKEIRSLLCTNCNLMIGHSKENIDILAKGISYLTSYLK